MNLCSSKYWSLWCWGWNVWGGLAQYNGWCYIGSNNVNSLAPGRFQFNFRKVIFKLTLVNGGWGISYEIALRWMPQDLTDDKSTLVQVMAWCRQATSHYLSQCWPRSMSPYGVTRPGGTMWHYGTWVNVGSGNVLVPSHYLNQLDQYNKMHWLAVRKIIAFTVKPLI